jgi:hypothetical protein
MFNKTVTVTTTELSSGVVAVPATLLVNRKREDLSRGWFSGTLYPRELQIVNNTGADLEWSIMSSEEEYQDYVLNSTEPEFGFVLLPNLEVLQDEKRTNRMTYFLVKPAAGQTASANLRIDFINLKQG